MLQAIKVRHTLMLRKLCERFFLLLYLLKDLLVLIVLDVVSYDLRHIRNCDKKLEEAVKQHPLANVTAKDIKREIQKNRKELEDDIKED